MDKITLNYLENTPVRIDKYISESVEELTRSAISTLIEKELVLVNQKTVSKSYKLKYGDDIEITLPDPVLDKALPEDIPVDIVYEDDDLLVVNKPKGMVVHPAPGNYTGTLVNALLYHCKGKLSGINGVIRPGIVHRIDKDTSGLLIVAKNDNAHNFLAKQIKEHTFTREYETICYGVVKQDTGTIDAPIGRHPIKRKQMAVIDKNSKPAVTHFTVIERFRDHTHLRLKLETGRTHQIRVHLSYIGKPVFNDPVYTTRKGTKDFSGQCLHAKKIGFIHPNGEYMEFDSELPKYFKDQLNKFSGSI